VSIFIRGDHFLFGFVFIQKNNLTKFFLFKKTETGSNQPVLVRFDFLGQKSVQTDWLSFFGLARFWLDFSGLARFFFRFVSVWVRFSFFGFRLIKSN
jgi:hypothetical protein